MEYIIIISVICGAIGLILGSSRAATWDGLLYGIFLGPLGLILILLFNGNQIKCPHCQKYIDPKAVKCPYCQSEIKKNTEG